MMSCDVDGCECFLNLFFGIRHSRERGTDADLKKMPPRGIHTFDHFDYARWISILDWGVGFFLADFFHNTRNKKGGRQRKRGR